MSKLETLPRHSLKTGGFLSFSVVGDLSILTILGYFTAHAVRRAGALFALHTLNVAAWAPVVLASAILLVLLPLVGGRLWSQVSTRYTSQGVSQWRFLSYRALAWREIERIYYDRHGLVLEGRTRAIRILTGFYRRPEQMLGVVHAHVSSGAAQPARAQVANTVRPGPSGFLLQDVVAVRSA